ncbi:MAG TPA: hypothetical protein PLM16_02260 [Candidatus Woesebacteria bacterium]|nr:hypothetical protein [Candidatus Woesebacteria bacterium]
MLLLLGGLVESTDYVPIAVTPEYELKKPQSIPVILANDDQATVVSDSLTQVTAASYLVLDLNSGSILISRNIFLPLYPASTVKLMTALVALEQYAQTSFLSCHQSMQVAGNKVGLKAGYWMSVEDLLKATLINSGNDAALVLAHNSQGGYDQFVDKMNQKASQLSMLQTHFSNPTGLDDPTQLSSSWDLSLLARAVLNEPQLMSIVSTKQTSVIEYPTQREIFLSNTNQLLNPDDSINGMKTGTTQLAKQVLIASWIWQDHPLLIVVMGSDDRYQDTRLLMTWVKKFVIWTD